jgi:hypothetical protein
MNLEKEQKELEISALHPCQTSYLPTALLHGALALIQPGLTKMYRLDITIETQEQIKRERGKAAETELYLLGVEGAPMQDSDFLFGSNENEAKKRRRKKLLPLCLCCCCCCCCG